MLDFIRNSIAEMCGTGSKKKNKMEKNEFRSSLLGEAYTNDTKHDIHPTL